MSYIDLIPISSHHYQPVNVKCEYTLVSTSSSWAMRSACNNSLWAPLMRKLKRATSRLHAVRRTNSVQHSTWLSQVMNNVIKYSSFGENFVWKGLFEFYEFYACERASPVVGARSSNLWSVNDLFVTSGGKIDVNLPQGKTTSHSLFQLFNLQVNSTFQRLNWLQ